MPRSSPDSPSGRSPDLPNCEVHLTARTGSRDPRRHRFDTTVAAFVAACRAEVLSERTIEFYLEGLNSYRAFSGAESAISPWPTSTWIPVLGGIPELSIAEIVSTSPPCGSAAATSSGREVRA